MKAIPNIITILRILLSIQLIIIQPMSTMFFAIYLTCCISDILDGYIARKTNTTSTLGSKLDSIADLIFVLVVFMKLLPLIKVPLYIIIWIVIIFILRLISIAIVFYKYKTFAILHTYLNKVTGFTLIFVPLLMYWVDIIFISIIICTIAIISCIEELIINIKSTRLNRDIKGLFY